MFKDISMSEEEEVIIVQSIASGNELSDYCLDDKGNIYKIESGQKNELTLVKQTINIVIPEFD